MFNLTLNDFINENKLPKDFEASAVRYFIPLIERLLTHHNGAEKPLFVGINGCQGSGKSTLADFIKTYLQSEVGLNVVALSLDDFYYSKQKRAELAETIHPLLATRGVPGTHDTKHIQTVFEKLSKNDTKLRLPAFNKATDNPHPIEDWQYSPEQVDVVLFEGWCWGVKAQSSARIEQPVNAFEQNHDSDCRWRHYVNQVLAEHYENLYNYFDHWVMLKAPSFNDVYQWRLEQEQKLREKVPEDQQNNIMSPSQIHDFIQYYQRLTEHALTTLPTRCDHVFELNSQRKIIKYTKRNTYA